MPPARPGRGAEPQHGFPAHARYEEEQPELVEDEYDEGYDHEADYAEYPADYGEDYGDEHDDRYEDEEYQEEHDDDPVGALLDDESPAPRRRRSRGGGRRRSAGRRLAGWALAVALIGVLAVGAWLGAKKLLGFGYEDFDGDGKGDVVVQVVEGDSTAAIAQRLTESGVVASNKAFLKAAEANEAIRSIQPGFYQVKKQMSGAAAVEAIVDDKARVGHLQIRAGTQLDDLKDPKGKKVPGIYTLLSKATCAELDGKSTCVPAKKLRAAAEKADLAEIGVPEWLADRAKKAPKDRRLEGMVMPGVYDVKPGWSAERVLEEVLALSAAQFEAAGLPEAAEQTEHDAYEIVVIASIIEREAVVNDFGKVARVIYNRLDDGTRLEMDSTINYMLERPHIRTSFGDRNKQSPYNTYRNKTLPPTPISSPSPDAIQAALKPPRGSWRYFVKCEKNGLSCFSDDFHEHQTNIADARRRGVW